MIKNAIMQYATNLVIAVLESENPILTPQPDFVIDITNYLDIVEVGMFYNSELETFESIENVNTEN